MYTIHIEIDGEIWNRAIKLVQSIGYISLWSLSKDKRDYYIMKSSPL